MAAGDGVTPLPDVPAGTVAILSTGGGPPLAIPVSALVRVDGRRMLLALASGRESLARVRREPRVAVTLMAEGNIAVTAEGRARVVAERLPDADDVSAVLVTTVRVKDHGQPTFTVDAGVRWHWIDEAASSRDAAVRAALTASAADIGPPGGA